MVLLVLLVLWFSSSCTIDEDRTEIRTCNVQLAELAEVHHGLPCPENIHTYFLKAGLCFAAVLMLFATGFDICFIASENNFARGNAPTTIFLHSRSQFTGCHLYSQWGGVGWGGVGWGGAVIVWCFCLIFCGVSCIVMTFSLSFISFIFFLFSSVLNIIF